MRNFFTLFQTTLDLLLVIYINMNSQEDAKPCVYFAIGLMSGSSLDGLDIAYCTFQKKHVTPEKWDHAVILGETIPFPKELELRLRGADKLTAEEFCVLDWDLGYWIGDQVKDFITRNGIQRIDLIGSHGHTIFHNPRAKYTVQIGNAACIAAKTKRLVISDFRSIDVALGGQGAPLVPIGDRLLYEKYTFCLNLGGIANITYTEPLQQKHVQAFDICVCNQLLNTLAQEVLEIGYDKDGDIAKSGEVNCELLNRLNALEFHQQTPPKSLANQYLFDAVLPLFQEEEFANIPSNNKLATAVQMIVDQIANVVENVQKSLSANDVMNQSLYMPKFQQVISEVAELTDEDIKDKPQIQEPKVDLREHMKLLASGGGVYNKYLFDKLKKSLLILGVEVETEEATIKFKEAMIFAFLGVLRFRKEVNVLSSVTGAQQNNIGGAIYYHYE